MNEGGLGGDGDGSRDEREGGISQGLTIGCWVGLI